MEEPSDHGSGARCTRSGVLRANQIRQRPASLARELRARLRPRRNLLRPLRLAV